MDEGSNQPWAILDINVIVMCVLLSYSIGSNNTGNSWSTAYSTRTLSLKKCLIIGFIFEVLGAALLRHRIEERLGKLFQFQPPPDKTAKSLFFFGMTSSQLTALIIFSIANSYSYVLSSSQIAICTMLGTSIASYSIESDAKHIVQWFPLFAAVVIGWFVVPIFSLLLSPFIFWIINRTVLISNTRLRSFIVTPYISGFVFMIFFAFIFTIDNIANSSPYTKAIIIPLFLIISFFIGIGLGKKTSDSYCE